MPGFGTALKPANPREHRTLNDLIAQFRVGRSSSPRLNPLNKLDSESQYGAEAHEHHEGYQHHASCSRHVLVLQCNSTAHNSGIQYFTIVSASQSINPIDLQLLTQSFTAGGQPERMPERLALSTTWPFSQNHQPCWTWLGFSINSLEGLNSRIRMISHRGFGFVSAGPLIAMNRLCRSRGAKPGFPVGKFPRER